MSSIKTAPRNYINKPQQERRPPPLEPELSCFWAGPSEEHVPQGTVPGPEEKPRADSTGPRALGQGGGGRCAAGGPTFVCHNLRCSSRHAQPPVSEPARRRCAWAPDSRRRRPKATVVRTARAGIVPRGSPVSQPGPRDKGSQAILAREQRSSRCWHRLGVWETPSVDGFPNSQQALGRRRRP